MNNILEFDPVSHKYTMDGLEVPGVTTVIQHAGLIDFSHVSKAVLKQAADFGHAVHEAVSLFDCGILKEDSVDSQIRPCLEAWIKFRKTFGGKIISNEDMVYSAKHNFAGTIDRIFTKEGKYFIIDVKTCNHHPSHGVQVEAYKLAAEEYFTLEITTCYTVRLFIDDGVGRWDMKEHNSLVDVAAFRSALNIYNWKKTKGLI